MRKWGVVITLFYAFILVALLVPAGILLAGGSFELPQNQLDLIGDLKNTLSTWFPWVPVTILVAAQALLLFVSVDTSFKKLKPRAHVAVTSAAAAILFMLMAIASIFSAGSAIRGDKFEIPGSWPGTIALCLLLWAVWGYLFYRFWRNSDEAPGRAVKWLLAGSVLELLVAVPCHVIVRRRNECCAPIFTSFGIVTGIAVMLLAFGPSVLLLFKKRLDGYAKNRTA